ncbi:MAG TPA: hypothetical protein VFO31_23060, partial [Vicinamibacterales bacterium]|nr:hypothetical protein [Vicinamibacterales bacterium]
MTKQRGTTALLPAAALVMAWLFAPPVAYAAVAGASFDHLTTGFELTGAHRVVPCESCHADAVFRGTPRRCESCHVIGSRISATAKPADHVVSNNDCARCHTTSAWSPSLRYDHSDVTGNCASCHNGVQSAGKPPGHIATTQDCGACHRTTAWTPAGFDHSAV